MGLVEALRGALSLSLFVTGRCGEVDGEVDGEVKESNYLHKLVDSLGCDAIAKCSYRVPYRCSAVQWEPKLFGRLSSSSSTTFHCIACSSLATTFAFISSSVPLLTILLPFPPPKSSPCCLELASLLSSPYPERSNPHLAAPSPPPQHPYQTPRPPRAGSATCTRASGNASSLAALPRKSPPQAASSMRWPPNGGR